MSITGLYWWQVNTGSDSGLVPSDNKPLPAASLGHNEFKGYNIFQDAFKPCLQMTRIGKCLLRCTGEWQNVVLLLYVVFNVLPVQDTIRAFEFEFVWHRKKAEILLCCSVLQYCCEQGGTVVLFGFLEVYFIKRTSADLPCINYCMAFFCRLVPHKWPLLLTWFNFNPSMDK